VASLALRTRLTRFVGTPITRYFAVLFILLISLAGLATPVRAASLPDLRVDSIWLEDASNLGQPITQVASGESFLIVATVKNLGGTTASGYYLDVYYDSDYGRGGPDNITAGEVQTWYVGPLTAQDGTHTAQWIVDPDNQIAEADENNNQKALSFTVGSVVLTNTTTVISSTNTTTGTSSSTSTTSTSTTSSQSSHPTLALSPTSGSAGTVVSVSGTNYQGTACVLTSNPAGVFTLETCTISAGALTGSFTVDPGAPAGNYTVTAQTEMGSIDSATSRFTDVPPPVLVSDASATIFGTSAMPSYFIGTSNPYDNQALLGAWGMKSTEREIGPCTRTDWVDQSTGRPLIGGDLLLVAGPLANTVLKYYVSQGLAASFRFLGSSGQIVYRGQVLAEMPAGDIGAGKDMFVVQALKDGNRSVLTIWGVGAQGTLASGVWLIGNSGQLGSLQHSIYVYGWADLNGDGYAQPDEISLIYQGD